MGQFPSSPCSATAGVSLAPSWHLEKFGKFKIFWRVYLLLSSLPGSWSQKGGGGKWGGGGGKGVGTETKIRREIALREGVGTPKGAPQLAWFSSEFLERIRKTPNTSSPSIPAHPALTYYPVPYQPYHPIVGTCALPQPPALQSHKGKGHLKD